MADVDDVAASILSATGPVEAMKLQKLLYYAQAWHLAITGEQLFPEPIEAWRQGPVVRSVFEKHRRRRRVYDWSGDPNRLSESAESIITMVCEQYGNYSGDELSAMTHRELPWNEARVGLPSNASSQRPIQVSRIKEFYRSEHTLLGQYAGDIAVGGRSSRGPVGGPPIDVDALLRSISTSVEPATSEVIGRGQGLDGVTPPPSSRRTSNSEPRD